MKRDRMCWLFDDDAFKYRCGEWSPELIKSNDIHAELNPLVRDDYESTDCIVVLGDELQEDMLPMKDISPSPDHQELVLCSRWECSDEQIEEATMHHVPLRVIRRRPAEFSFVPNSEDADEPDEVFEMRKDGTLVPYVETDDDVESDCSDVEFQSLNEEGLGRTIPRDKYDLLTDENNGYSAPWFPCLRDKRMRGYAKRFEKVISRGINGRYLHAAIQDGLKAKKLNLQEVRRIWELFKIEQFIRYKKDQE